MTTTNQGDAVPETTARTAVDTVTQTVTLACGHWHIYPNVWRTLAESGFAAPSIAWFCDTCDPTHHTQQPIVTVHNEPVTDD
jgi:hypothetical protein